MSWIKLKIKQYESISKLNYKFLNNKHFVLLDNLTILEFYNLEHCVPNKRAKNARI